METLEQKTNNNNLVLFLQHLANSIQNNTISPEHLQLTGEFFMSFEMSQQETNTPCDTMDVIKFITMGWYIYSILNNNTCNTPTSD